MSQTRNTQTNLLQTNFERVIEFNKTFGVLTHDSVQRNIFDTNPELVQRRLDLITEEYNELKEAITNKDMTETIDALADILYVVYGMGDALGINLDLAVDMVHASNMSKLCQNEDEAKSTVEWYNSQYEDGKLRYDSVSYRLDEGSGKYVVYNQNSGKILKNINYNPVNFNDFNN